MALFKKPRNKLPQIPRKKYWVYLITHRILKLFGFHVSHLITHNGAIAIMIASEEITYKEGCGVAMDPNPLF